MTTYVYDVNRVDKLMSFLHSVDCFQFSPSYVNTVCSYPAPGQPITKISHSEYFRRCIVPDVPKSQSLITTVAGLVRLVNNILAHETTFAFDSENCSFSTQFEEWGSKFQSRYVFQPARPDKKGPFMVLLSIALITGECYLIDVRKTGFGPLRDIFDDPSVFKLHWDKDSETRTFLNTFDYVLNESCIDVQRWAQDDQVNSGKKTKLSSYVSLFRGLNICQDKEKWHRFNWNTVSWSFPDTKEALTYSAQDSLYNLSIAAGLASTLPTVKQDFAETAARLRYRAFT